MSEAHAAEGVEATTRLSALVARAAEVQEAIDAEVLALVRCGNSWTAIGKALARHPASDASALSAPPRRPAPRLGKGLDKRADRRDALATVPSQPGAGLMAARQSNGRSSVYPGADGRWHGRVTMGVKNDGRLDRPHVTDTSRAEATAKVQVLERQRAAGRVAEAGRSPTVEAWLRHWLEHIAVRRVRPSTLDGYRSKVEHRLIPGLGKHRLDRLQPEHVEAFYNALATEGLASSDRAAAAPNPLPSPQGRRAARQGRPQRVRAGRRPEPRPGRGRTPHAGRSSGTAGRAVGQRNAARWSVSLALGLRQGEALGLRWVDVDLDAGTLAVRQALQRVRGKGLVIVPPKSRASRRRLRSRLSSSTACRPTGPLSSRSGSAPARSGKSTGSLRPAERPAHRPAAGLRRVEGPAAAPA